MADDKPIIIVKKKGHHGGHHGGAWKVAYADFVTAMMAFFMVMWLVNSAEVATRQNIASYFKRPGIFQQGSGTPLLLGEAGILSDAYTPPSGMRSKYKGKFAGPGYGDQRDLITEKIGSEPYDPDLDGKERKGKGPGIGGEGTDESAHPETDSTLPEWKKNEAAVIWRKKGQTDDIEYNIATTSKDAAGTQQVKPGAGAVHGTADGTALIKAEKPGPGVGATGKESGVRHGDEKTMIDKVAAAKAERKALYDIAEDLRRKIKVTPDLREALGDVIAEVEADGLHIEVLDTGKTSMFAAGSAQVLPPAREAFNKVAEILKKIPNHIELVGHTDAKPFSGKVGGYSNWELSADRANSVRRILEGAGLEPERFASVVGRADRDPLIEGDPTAAENRRITLRVRFNYSDPLVLENFEPVKKMADAVQVNYLPQKENSISKDSAHAVPHEQAAGADEEPSDTDHGLSESKETTDGVKITRGPKATGWRPKRMIQGAKEEKKVIALPEVNLENEPAADTGSPNNQNAPSGGIFKESPIISSPGVLSGLP